MRRARHRIRSVIKVLHFGSGKRVRRAPDHWQRIPQPAGNSLTEGGTEADHVHLVLVFSGILIGDRPGPARVLAEPLRAVVCNPALR